MLLSSRPPAKRVVVPNLFRTMYMERSPKQWRRRRPRKTAPETETSQHMYNMRRSVMEPCGLSMWKRSSNVPRKGAQITLSMENGGQCIRHGAAVYRCSSERCTNIVQKRGVCVKQHDHSAKEKECGSEECTNVAQQGGVQNHGVKQQAAVVVPALPIIDLESTETECVICMENISEMVTCAAENACSCVVCHDCLVACFSSRWRKISGQLVEYDPTQCPNCRETGAFSLETKETQLLNKEIYET